MTPKTIRQKTIAALLANEAVTSQEQIVEHLAGEGLSATQATVSRDLDDLGAIKVRLAGGVAAYAIPDHPHEQVIPPDHLRRVVAEWVVGADASANLVIVRTQPGSAHVVASAIDRSGLDEVLGTVAGDDTLMIVAAAGYEGDEVAALFRDYAGLG